VEPIKIGHRYIGSVSGRLGETSPYIGIVPGYIREVSGYIPRVWKYIAGLCGALETLGVNREEGARNVGESHFYIVRLKKYIAATSPAPPRLSRYIFSI
jgi:hypothetical protein